MEESFVPFLFVGLLFVFLILVPSVRRPKARTKQSHGVSPRFKMFLLGALLIEAYVIAATVPRGAHYFSYLFDLRFQLSLLLRGGISALILYEIIWRTRSRLNSATFPLYVLGVWYIQHPIDSGLYLLAATVQGKISEAMRSYYSNPGHWLIPAWSFTYTTLDLLTAFLTVAVGYYLIFGQFPSISARQTATPSGAFYGGTNVSTDETTRLLCASAFTSGHGFRRTVLDRFEEKHCAAAPEVGVDISLVAQACKFANDREKRYDRLFLLIGFGAAIVAAATDPTWGLGVLVLASAALYLEKGVREQGILRRYFQRGKFDTSVVRDKLSAPLDPETVSGLPTQDQNLIIYRDFTPFIGAGINLGGWSFTVGLDKPSEQELGASRAQEPIAFVSPEIYAAIDLAVESLGLEHLSIRDVCFVNGTDIREDRTVLPDIYGRPALKLDSAVADSYKKSSDPRIRHYQWICVHDWGNAMAMSYFLRCSIRGSSLFVEISRYLLTPLVDSCYSVDRLLASRWRHKVGLAAGSILLGPVWVVRAVFVTFGKLAKITDRIFDTKEHTRRREIEDNPIYNYGAHTSIRQTLSSNSFSHYFQKVDGDFYTKVLEHKILDAIVTFLDEHNVDTSEIRERRTLILNSGIIVQGGDVTAESLAVGAGATAVKSQPGEHSKKHSSQDKAAA